MLPVGTLLQNGKYRIERYLSSGGFGNTYVATNTEFEEQIAIKEFFMRGITERDGDSVSVSVSNRNNIEQFTSQKEKFKKEARRLRRLKNEHIVGVHDLFEENGTAYYEMDLIKGESLAERMKRTDQPLSEEDVLKILDQVLDALSVVHAQGLYHLDLKPANIMIDETGRALLIDFGASKQVSAGDGLSVSTSSALAFTPGFAPLEQTEQNIKSFGPWTDLYALGATLYKLLTGLTPPSASEILMTSTSLSFPTPISTKTQQLIAWMMKPRIDERPQRVEEIRLFLSGSDFKQANEVYKDIFKPQLQENEETKPVPLIQPKQEHSNNSRRRIIVTFSIIGMILFSCMAGGFFLLNSMAREKKFRLHTCGVFYEGLANYKDKNNKWGYIDGTGDIVIPCQWKNAGSFSEGLAKVQDANGMYGFIDKTGKIVISCQWKDVGPFCEGLARVADDNWKYGFIDKTGQVVIPYQWYKAGNFQEGLAAVRDAKGMYGYINKTGLVVISYQWKDADPFKHGRAWVKDEKGLWNKIDKTGQIVNE